MNRTYKVIWNYSKSVYEVISELGKGKTKSSSSASASRPAKRISFVNRSLAVTLATLPCLCAAAIQGIDSDYLVATNTSVVPGDSWSVKKNVMVTVAKGVTLTTMTGKPTGGGIFLKEGAELVNYGTVLNNYFITKDDLKSTAVRNFGIFRNGGELWVNTIENGAASKLENIDRMLAEVLTNAGNVGNAGTAKVDQFINAETGAIENTGTWMIFNSLTPSVNNGYFNNVGTLSVKNSNSATLTNGAKGRFHNVNLIGDGNDSITINNLGEFKNLLTGNMRVREINNSGEGKFYSSGSLLTNGIQGTDKSEFYVLDNGKLQIKANGNLNLSNDNGITLKGEALFQNNDGGKIVLTNNSDNSFLGLQVSVGEQSKFVNGGSINVEAEGKHEGKVRLQVKDSGRFDNDGVINMQANTNATLSVMDAAVFNNNAGGRIVIAENNQIKVGEPSDVWSTSNDTSATFVNSGIISNNGIVSLHRNGSKFIAKAGSTFSGGELRVVHSGAMPANASLTFDGGPSTFYPAAIRFDAAGNYSNGPSVLNIGVDGNFEQRIEANIERTAYGSSGNYHDGKINKTGIGTLILNGNNTYTQGTDVQAGKLFIGDAAGRPSKIDSGVTVRNGATFGGHGTVNGNVTVDGGGRLSAGLGLNNAGRLTINGDLTLNSTSQIDYDMSSNATSDSFAVSGNLATNGAKVNVNSIDHISAGLMRELFSYGTATNTDLTVGSTPSGTAAGDYTFTNNGNKIYINAKKSGTVDNSLKFWNPNAAASAMGSGGNGVWQTGGNTWTNLDGSAAPGELDANADFAVFAGQSGNVTVNGTVSAKGLQFLNNYTLSGGSINLGNAGGLAYISTGGNAASTNTVTISSELTGNVGINKVDGGTLTLTGNNSYTGNTMVSAGTLKGNSASIRGDVEIKNDAKLDLSASASESFGGAITGKGQFVKSGAGELTLTGNNRYSGGTSVLNGTLTGTVDALQGAIDVASGAMLKFEQKNGEVNTFNGTLSGAGDVTIGSHVNGLTLAMKGKNSLTGTMYLQDYTILIGNTDSISGNVDIVRNSELRFEQDSDGIYKGKITGNGYVYKKGAGTLTLTGDMTVSSLQVQTGLVELDSLSGGAARINGNVDVWSSNTGSGTFGGSGTVTGRVYLQRNANLLANANGKLSVGNLELSSGFSTLTVKGLTTIDSANEVRDIIESQTELQPYDFEKVIIEGVDENTDYLFASVMKDATNKKYQLHYGLSWFSADPNKVSGSFTLADGKEFAVNTALTDMSSTVPAVNNANWDGNSLVKQGAGKLILNGVNTYSGLTDVRGGSLIVGGSSTNANAQIAGDVKVGSGATLGGHGKILGDVTMNSGSKLSPGNSIGTLTVNNITFNRGSVYEFEANADGTSDGLTVTNTATINGGSVSVLAGKGTWSGTTSYTIMNSANPITGAFDNVYTNLAFLTPTLSYTGNEVKLDLTRNSSAFADVAFTSNQFNLANAIGALPTSHPIAGVVTGMSAAQARDAYDNLSGEIHAGVASAMINNGQAVRHTVYGHLVGQPGVDKQLWINALGHQGELKSDGNAGKMKNSGVGFMVGMDAFAAGNSVLGVTAGYERTTLKQRDVRQSKADIDVLHAMVYGRTALGPVDLRGGAGYSWMDIDTERDITVPTLESQNKAGYHGELWQAFLEASHTFKVSESMSVAPYAGMVFNHMRSGSFTETGGVTALQGKRDSKDMASTQLGVRSSFSLNHASSAYLDAAWQYNINGVSPEKRMSFSGAGESFTVKGVSMDRNSALLGGGIDIALSGATSLNVGYQGVFGDQSRDHRAKIGLAVTF